MSAADEALPELRKKLLFTSDDHSDVAADLESLPQLDEHSLLITSDYDFGVGEKETAFYRVRF